VTVVDRQRGFALLMVLWTLILLAFLATVYADNARTEVYLARNLVDNAQAEALADGGIYQAIGGLSRQPADGGYYGDGRVYVWPTEAGEVRFSIRDEGGKVDVNQAPDVLLRELMVVVGVEPGLAAELADAIIDFRDEDEDKRSRGAEAREYRAAGLDYGPKNERIVLVEELIYVPGMTADLLARLAPLLTTFGQEEVPHEPTAPPEVREAVIAALNAARGGGRNAGTSSRTGSDSRTTGRSSRDSGTSSGSGSGSSFGSRSGFGSGSSSSSSSSASRSSSGSGFGSGSSFGSGSGSRSGFGSGSSFGSGSRSGSVFGDDEDASDEDGGSTFGQGAVDQVEEDRSGLTVFTIHAEARTLNGTIFVREAVVDVAGGEEQPVVFHAWRQGVARLFAPGQSLDATPPVP